MRGAAKGMLRLDLDEEVAPPAKLFGLSSHVRDYRLCWSLNNSLGINLKKRNSSVGEIQFACINSAQEWCYTLIQNRTASGLLLPELKQADFLFFVQHGEDAEEIDHYSGLQRAQFVNAVFSLDPKKWNEAFRLIEIDGY